MPTEKRSKIKGVLLDLDDTLYSYPECNEAGMGAVMKYLSEKLKVPSSKVKRAYEKGREETHKELHGFAASHSRLLYIKKALEILEQKTNFKLTLETEKIFWNAFLKKMKLKPGVLRILKKLKTENSKLKICIVTDLTSEIQFRKILKLKIEKYFDFLVTSEEAGQEKPNPKIFKLALQKLRLKPSEVIMVGDDKKKDLTGARKLGIKAFEKLEDINFRE